MIEVPKNIPGAERSPKDEGKLYRRRIRTLSRSVKRHGISESDRSIFAKNLEETINQYEEFSEKHPEAKERFPGEDIVEKLRRIYTAEVIEPKEKYL